MEHSGLPSQLRGLTVNSTCSDFAWPGCRVPKVLLDSGWGIQHCINWMLVHLRTKEKKKQHSGASLQAGTQHAESRWSEFLLEPFFIFFPNSLIKSWLKTQTFCHPYYSNLISKLAWLDESWCCCLCLVNYCMDTRDQLMPSIKAWIILSINES